jgi:hypothetical protein
MKAVSLTKEFVYYATSFNQNVEVVWANFSRTVKNSPCITQHAKCTFHNSSCTI